MMELRDVSRVVKFVQTFSELSRRLEQAARPFEMPSSCPWGQR